MVRAVLVVSRDSCAPNELGAYASLLNRTLAADHIEPRPPTVVQRPGLTAAVLNPSGAARVQGASLAIGTLLEPSGDWHVPRAPLPDGSYALLRADDDYVELAADGVASRTLWYALTDRELIASTSQRAIVTLLGSFVPNRAVLPWMLSSGTLGPSGGWDARLTRVQPGERVLLDRARWRLQSSVEATEHVAEPGLSYDAQLERLRSTVVDACRRWSFDARKWVLTLSGGADSRGLLYLLQDRGLATVTWGLPHSDEKQGNDAYVARELARSLGTAHRFIALEPAEVDPETVLQRFLSIGEGRVDRLSGYIDGFRVWKTLFDEGCTGVIRGDHAFGSSRVRSEYAVRSKTSLTTLSDYFPANEIEKFELPEQRVPEALLRARSETIAGWRDRLFRQSRIPSFLAALTDLKTAHVDVANPLLTRSVLACVRTLPDELRTEKRLWREFVHSQLPELPLARRVAIPSAADFLSQRRVLQVLLDELDSTRADTALPAALRLRCRAALLDALQAKRRGVRMDWRESALARVVPAKLRAAVSRLRPHRPGVPPVVLAFRAFLASRMQTMLAADAATRPPAVPLRAWGTR
jgi:hypothetical protein